MRIQLEQQARRGWQFAERWWHLRAQELHQCRECGHETQPLESVCPHCGASHPVRVSVSAGVVAAMVGVVLMLLAVWVL